MWKKKPQEGKEDQEEGTTTDAWELHAAFVLEKRKTNFALSCVQFLLYRAMIDILPNILIFTDQFHFWSKQCCVVSCDDRTYTVY